MYHNDILAWATSKIIRFKFFRQSIDHPKNFHDTLDYTLPQDERYHNTNTKPSILFMESPKQDKNYIGRKRTTVLITW